MYACLVQTACSILVTTVMSVGGKAYFSTVVINIKSDAKGEERQCYSDNKTSVFITPQTGPQGQTACMSHDHNNQIIDCCRSSSVNHRLEQSVGLVAYN